MLNALEAEAAFTAIPRIRDTDSTTKDDSLAIRIAYNEAVKNIASELREWLTKEYASDLPVGVQNQVWAKAWAEGVDSGYDAVEAHFIDWANFARLAVYVLT